MGVYASTLVGLEQAIDARLREHGLIADPQDGDKDGDTDTPTEQDGQHAAS